MSHPDGYVDAGSDVDNSATRAYWQREREANARSLDYKAQDDRLRDQAWERNRPLREAEAEAARDRAERADPATRPWAEERDHQAAAGRFAHADSLQRLIDSVRRDQTATRDTEARRSAERAERRQVEDRETDAQLRHNRFPFWHDRDRPEPGPTDRPGVIERASVHQLQGRTQDRVDVADVIANLPRLRAERVRSRDYPPASRGREEQQR